jgi:hypothetical protein
MRAPRTASGEQPRAGGEIVTEAPPGAAPEVADGLGQIAAAHHIAARAIDYAEVGVDVGAVDEALGIYAGRRVWMHFRSCVRSVP